MIQNNLTNGASLRLTANKLKRAKRPILAAYLSVLLLLLLLRWFTYAVHVTFPAYLFYLNDSALFILKEVLIVGICYFGVRRASNLPISFRNIYIVFAYLLTVIMPALLLSLMLIVNGSFFLLFLFPIIYLIIRYSFSTMLILDKANRSFNNEQPY